MSTSTTTLRFQYFEIVDHDHTLTWVELIEGGQATRTFTNYPERWDSRLHAEVYGNQSEDFQFPTKDAALAMLRSNPAYREIQGERPWQTAKQSLS